MRPASAPAAGPARRHHQLRATARVLQRRKLVLDLTRRGLPIRRIVDALKQQGQGVSHAQVHRDLHAALDELAAEQRELAELARTMLADRAREMYRLAYPRAVEGDARAIAVALRAIETEAKLLGVLSDTEGGAGGGEFHFHFGADTSAWPEPERQLEPPTIETTARPVAEEE